MESSVRFSVGNKAISLLVGLIALRQILVGVSYKIVSIDKVITLFSVVWRVEIDQLNLAEVSLLQ
ncbi:hypothetical protein D9M71_737110 [compost metagenome]